jgi:hypothetical protein
MLYSKQFRVNIWLGPIFKAFLICNESDEEVHDQFNQFNNVLLLNIVPRPVRNIMHAAADDNDEVANSTIHNNMIVPLQHWCPRKNRKI